MKTTTKNFKLLKKSFGIFTVLILFSIVSCKKQVPEKELFLENIKLSFEQVITPASPNNREYSWIQLIENDIFFASHSNSGSNDQYMLKYNIVKNTYTEVTPHKGLCLCGYMNRLATDGKSLYYIANEAWKYTVATDTWSQLNYPSSVQANNTGAASAYHNGKLYFAGGGGKKQFRCYDIASDSWLNMPDLPENVFIDEGIAVGNQIFIMGESLRKKIYNYDIDSKKWSEKKEAPFDIYTLSTTLYLAKTKNRFVYYYNYRQNNISIYDTKTDEWRVSALYGLPRVSDLLSYNDNTLYFTVNDKSRGILIYKINVAYE